MEDWPGSITNRCCAMLKVRDRAKSQCAKITPDWGIHHLKLWRLTSKGMMIIKPNPLWLGRGACSLLAHKSTPSNLCHIYLPLILLLILLGEYRVDPPDLGEHAAICKAETQTKQPQAKLAEWKKRGRFHN